MPSGDLGGNGFSVQKSILPTEKGFREKEVLSHLLIAEEFGVVGRFFQRLTGFSKHKFCLFYFLGS